MDVTIFHKTLTSTLRVIQNNSKKSIRRFENNDVCLKNLKNKTKKTKRTRLAIVVLVTIGLYYCCFCINKRTGCMTSTIFAMMICAF